MRWGMKQTAALLAALLSAMYRRVSYPLRRGLMQGSQGQLRQAALRTLTGFWKEVAASLHAWWAEAGRSYFTEPMSGVLYRLCLAGSIVWVAPWAVLFALDGRLGLELYVIVWLFLPPGVFLLAVSVPIWTFRLLSRRWWR